MYLAEVENLEVAAGQQEYVLEGIEDRMLGLCCCNADVCRRADTTYLFDSYLII
ncbi:hypothetical protein BGX38DRAFT_1162615 [Terfezia claveryi]|nr:hypothetical protein BGX38DRAFT_1162615 [Terfezia claveryi]